MSRHRADRDYEMTSYCATDELPVRNEIAMARNYTIAIGSTLRHRLLDGDRRYLEKVRIIVQIA